MTEHISQEHPTPGVQLASVRHAKGYSQEYVAGRLHLKLTLIEALEADDYARLPQSVFVKGYIRAYAKLLDVDSEPLIAQCNILLGGDSALATRTLWQGKRNAYHGERMIRWVSALMGLTLITAIAFWWNYNTGKLPIHEASKEKTTEDMVASLKIPVTLSTHQEVIPIKSSTMPLEVHGD